jgi:DNA-binding protein H-NS
MRHGKASTLVDSSPIIGRPPSGDEVTTTSRQGQKSTACCDQAGQPGTDDGTGDAEVPPKYRAPSGETWAGRGARPKWMVEALKKGKKMEHFLIKRRRG